MWRERFMTAAICGLCVAAMIAIGGVRTSTSRDGDTGVLTKYFSTYTAGVSETCYPETGDLHTWWKADGIGALNDGDPVATWPDDAGSVDLTQSTADYKPTWQTNELNSKPCVRFDGTDDVMTCAMADGFPWDSDFTFYLVFRLSTTGSDWGVFGAANAGGGYDGMTLTILDSTNKIEVWLGDAMAGVYSYEGTWTPDTSAHYLTFVSDGYDGMDMADGAGGTKLMYLDQSNLVSNAEDYRTSLASGDYFPVGATVMNGSTWSYFPGDIFELLAFDKAHSTAERESIWCYIRTKYGL